MVRTLSARLLATAKVELTLKNIQKNSAFRGRQHVRVAHASIGGQFLVKNVTSPPIF